MGVFRKTDESRSKSSEAKLGDDFRFCLPWNGQIQSHNFIIASPLSVFCGENKTVLKGKNKLLNRSLSLFFKGNLAVSGCPDWSLFDRQKYKFLAAAETPTYLWCLYQYSPKFLVAVHRKRPGKGNVMRKYESASLL